MNKPLILLLITSCSFRLFAQSTATPPLINYQGMARNANGSAIASQTIGVFFEFLQGSATGSVSYSEPQTIGTNSLGLFSTYIGKINSLVGFNWQNGPYFLKVSMDPSGGNAYIPLGQPQQLVSVPYALYAEKAGNGALPTATLNGTTLRYNNVNSNWIIDTNLINNGNKVSVGNRLNIKQNKFQSITTSSTDSSAVFGFHTSALANYAGVRGIATGSSASTGTNTSIGIFGGHFVGYNVSGTGIGSYGQGTSLNSNAIGLLGIGSSNGTSINNNYAIGLYATADATASATNKFAGIFDRGAVLINDSLFLGPATNPGAVGNVLTRTSTGRAIWQPLGTNTGPFTNSANYIHAAPSFTTNRIVFGVPYPVGGFPFQSRVSIVNTAANSNDTSLIVLQKNTSKPALYSEANGSGYALSALNTNSLLTAYAGLFDGGLITKGKNTFTTAFSFLAQDAIGTNLLSVRNDGNVGINTTVPTAKLHIKQNAGAFSALIAEQTSNVATASFSNTGSGSALYAMTSASGGTNPAIFGESVGTNTNNAGVYGLSSVSSGVKGLSQNSNGVWGESNNGVGVFGLSTQNGQAGKFLLQGNTSSFHAVYVATNSNPSALKSESFGNGAAIEAVHSSTSATSPHNSLRLIDGHIATVQGSGAFSIASAFGSGFTTGSTGSTDVAGTLQYVSGVSSVISGGGGNLTVTFNKSYPNKPIVVVSPVSSEWSKFSYYVVSATNGFTLFFTNNTTGNITLNNFTDAFSYFVIGVN